MTPAEHSYLIQEIDNMVYEHGKSMLREMGYQVEDFNKNDLHFLRRNNGFDNPDSVVKLDGKNMGFIFWKGVLGEAWEMEERIYNACYGIQRKLILPIYIVLGKVNIVEKRVLELRYLRFPGRRGIKEIRLTHNKDDIIVFDERWLNPFREFENEFYSEWML